MGKCIKNLSIIIARTGDGVIGINEGNGRLPWKMGTQKADMKRFKDLTTNNVVVMGNKTFKSIGSRPLPNRMNVVLSRSPQVEIDGVFFDSPSDIETYLINLCEVNKDKEVFIIGGVDLIKQVKSLPSKIYLSIIWGIKSCGCDNEIKFSLSDLEFFPYTTIKEEYIKADESNMHDCTFYDLQKSI